MNPIDRAKTLLVQDTSYELLDRSNNYDEKPPASYDPSNVLDRARRFVTGSSPAHVYSNPHSQLGRSTAPLVHRLTGWRYGVFLCTIGLGACLAFEVIFLILASVKGSGVLYSGDCASAQRYNIALLLPLNIVGVVVVGACNYVMQVVSAPSRKAIDKAHAGGKSLRIGQSSPHNLRYLRFWQKAIWIMLAITVIPALWALNAVVEPALQANNYGVTVVGFGYIEDFDYQSCYNITTGPSSRMSSGYETAICALQEGALSKNSSFVVLSNAECITAFGTSNGIQSKYSNVLIVTSNDTYAWAGVQSMDPTEVAPGVDIDVSNAFVDLNQPYGANMTYLTAGMNGQDHGIYLDQYSLVWNLPSLRASFNSFDYGRWTLARLKQYNFNDESILAYHNKFDSTVWMCNTAEVANAAPCSYNEVLRRESSWFITPENYKVDHCVAQVADQEHCQLSLSGKVLAGLIALDVIRLICVGIVLYTALHTGKTRPEDEPLMTLGDGISSFLSFPDPSTVDRCLLSLPELRSLKQSSSTRYSTRNPTGPQPIPLSWKAQSHFTLTLPSRLRTIITTLVFVLSVSFSLAILGYTITLAESATTGRNHPTSTILSLGLGSLSHIIPNEILLNGKISILDHGVPSDLLLTLPQILFAILYLVLNQYLTVLVQGHEMSSFSTLNNSSRLPVLRVSNPMPSSLQYSTTWLSLPYIYSLPLNVAFFLTHLFLSRALFVVPIDVWSYGTYRDTQRDLTGLGASPIAIGLVLVLTLACVLVVFVTGLRRLNRDVPVVGGDSLVISAICHDVGGRDAMGVEIGVEGAGEKEVRWGVIDEGKVMEPEEGEPGELVGHCSLTGREQVGRPVEGRLYA